MSHVRTQIRNAAAALLTGLATTGSNVFKTRTVPLDDAELPALKIYTNDEEIAPQTFHTNPLLERALQLTVVGCAKANSTLDDTLDDIAAEVEAKLNESEANNTFSGLAKSTVLQSLKVDTSDDLEQPVGTIEMNFTVVYYTQAATPEIAI